MQDPEPQTAAGKVHFAFMMSLDGFVAGPGHSMDFMERATTREGLLQEYIEATGAVLAGRDGYDSTTGIVPYGGAWQGPRKEPSGALTHDRPAAPASGPDRRDRHPHRAGPAGDGIRLYDVPGGEILHLQRDGDDTTLAANLRYRPVRVTQ